jgi:hypothetical protein
MRTTAKWMLAAAGAVGAALISGGPLVAVGQVHGTSHALLAGLGLVIALGGVGVAIWFTGQVLVPRLTTPKTMKKMKESRALAKLWAQIDDDPAEFMGVAAETLEGLFERHDQLRKLVADLARAVAREEAPDRPGAPAREKDPARLARLQANLSQATANEETVGSYVRWVLALGHAWLVRADLERSRIWTLGGGVLVVIGAVLFFIVTGSGKH